MRLRFQIPIKFLLIFLTRILYKFESGDSLHDGIYLARFSDGITYRIEKREGKWYMSDGTGWREELIYSEDIVIIRSLSYEVHTRGH